MAPLPATSGRVPTSWMPLAPFAVLFALLVVFAVGGMLVIAREANRSDAALARETVARTFQSVLSRLDSAVEMNAAAPPIASALSGPHTTAASVYGYLNFTSRDALGYHGTVVLNHDGSAFAGTLAGKPWTDDRLSEAARLVAPLARRLPEQTRAITHAVVRSRTGQPLAIAVINIIPATRATISRGRAAPLRRLAMIAPIGQQIVPKMLPSLGVDDFTIARVAADANAVTVPVLGGEHLVFAWRSRNPGYAAIKRWAPLIGALLIVAIAMLALAARATLRAISALEQLAHHDFLTGLANRWALHSELVRRQARSEPFALGMLDLNGFKQVNDQYGHLIGDGLLQAVAIQFAQSALPGDFVARLGGDEFAWVSPSPAAAQRLADEFARRIRFPLMVGDVHLPVGAATGIALAQPGISPSALMALADTRLYADKDASKQKPSGFLRPMQDCLPPPQILERSSAI